MSVTGSLNKAIGNKFVRASNKVRFFVIKDLSNYRLSHWTGKVTRFRYESWLRHRMRCSKQISSYREDVRS